MKKHEFSGHKNLLTKGTMGDAAIPRFLIYVWLFIYALLPFLDEYLVFLALAGAASLLVFRGYQKSRSEMLFPVFVLISVVCRNKSLMMMWPVPLLIPAALYLFLLCLYSGQPIGIVIRRGEWNKNAVYWGLFGALSSAAGLYAWLNFAQPDIGKLMIDLPKLPHLVLLVMAVAYYVINAATEELVFRGILFEELSKKNLGIAQALIIQAIAFGAIHRYGIPGGPSGMVLASVYGLIQGIIRVKTRGLLIPWLSHVVADLTILSILLRYL